MECIGNPVFSKVRVSESTRKGKRRCFCVGNPKLIPYETIVRATNGEPEAVDEVLRHYIKRIRIAAIENGHIDRDTEDSIKQRLVAALFKFRFDEQPYSKTNNRRYIGQHTKTGNQQKVSFFCAHFWHFSSRPPYSSSALSHKRLNNCV